MFFADVLSEGAWRMIAELQDLELKQLAKSLAGHLCRTMQIVPPASTFVLSSIGTSWLSCHEVLVYPVEEAHFALYFQILGDMVKSKLAVE